MSSPRWGGSVSSSVLMRLRLLGDGWIDSAAAARSCGESSPLRERHHVGPREQAVGLVVPRPLLVHKHARELARALEQVAVGTEAREPQVAQTRLPRAEQLPFAAQLEILLRELETVARVDEPLQTGLRGVRQLLPGTRDQQAVRLLAAAADAAAQLVELREPEAIGFLHDHDRRVRD